MKTDDLAHSLGIIYSSASIIKTMLREAVEKVKAEESRKLRDIFCSTCIIRPCCSVTCPDLKRKWLKKTNSGEELSKWAMEVASESWWGANWWGQADYVKEQQKVANAKAKNRGEQPGLQVIAKFHADARKIGKEIALISASPDLVSQVQKEIITSLITNLQELESAIPAN